MRRAILTCLALLLCLGGAVFAEAGRRGGPPGPGPIQNRVLDLLDDEILLVGGDPTSVWESERFATARANRIGLRAATADGSLPVRCEVCWQFAPDDACLDGVPLVYAPVPPPVPDDPTRPRPDAVPAPSLDFAEVRGLYARVRCRMPEIVFIGDDADAPPVVEATLTDVKVLLRRQ